MRWYWLAGWLALVVIFFHTELPQQCVLGLPASDVGRALWGWDHQARALPFPFASDDIAFPDGARLVVLPFVSSILGAPFRWILGQIYGFNAWMLTMHWATGFCVAMLARELTRSEAAGWIAGTALLVQPMQLVTLMDGTAEYVAFWSVPLTLLLLHAAKRTEDKRFALAAGFMGMVVALDSPYYAIFTMPFVPMVLPLKPRMIAWTALSAGLGLVVIFLLYYGIKVDPKPVKGFENVTQLVWWWSAEIGGFKAFPWERGALPTFIPLATLAGALLLAVLRPIKAAPWFFVGLLCVFLSLGTLERNVYTLDELFGPTGKAIGEAIVSVHESIHVPIIRFPRRWLIPAALGFFMAAEIGLSRLPWAWLRVVLGLVAAVGLVGATDRLLPYRQLPPYFVAPQPAFASFVADHPEDGATVLLPYERVQPRDGRARYLQPVFASLTDNLASFDELWLQAMCERPSVNYPNLDVLAARPRNPDMTRALRDLSDLTVPAVSGGQIPPSFYANMVVRANGIDHMINSGVRFVIVDEAAFGAEPFSMLRILFEDYIREEKHFDDGTGVTVWVVGPRAAPAPG